MLHFIHEENEKKLIEIKSKEKEGIDNCYYGNSLNTLSLSLCLLYIVEDERLQQECRELKEAMFTMNNDQLSFKSQITKVCIISYI